MPGSTSNYGWSKPLGTDLASTGDEVIAGALDGVDASLKAEETARIAADTATGTTFVPTGSLAATNVQAALAELDAEKANVVPLAPEIAALTLYGHSYVSGTTGPAQASTLGTWKERVKTKLNAGTVSDRSVGSTQMADFVGRALGTAASFVPGERALYIVDGTLNDVTPVGNQAKKEAGLRNSLRALLHTFAAGAKVEETSPRCAYTGTWATQAHAAYSGGSSKQTQTQNDYVDITFSADKVVVLLVGFDGGGGVAEIRRGATVLATVATTDAMLTSSGGLTTCPIAFPLAGFGAGPTTLRVIKTDATALPVRFDGFLLPAAAPPNVIVVKDCPIPHSSYAAAGGDANLAIFNGIVSTVAAEFPNVAVADPNQLAWTAASCIGADLVHPNDKGYRLYAGAILAAAAKLADSNGTTILGTMVLPIVTSTTPQSSGFAGTPATGSVSAGTVEASPWAGFANAIAAPQIDFASAAASALSAAFCVELKWRPVAAGMTTSEELARRYSSDNVVGAANYRIYNVPTGGFARLVAQWRDAGGVVRQIIGPGDISANTNHDVALTWDGTTMRLFRNGAVVGSLASSVEAPNATDPFIVGTSFGLGAATATIDEVRLSNVARYTAGYTPPAAPFVTDANTVILAHLDSIT